MILTCPACSTRYRIGDNAIGPEGRSVKCARCGHEWQQMPEDEAAAGEAEVTVADVAAAVEAVGGTSDGPAPAAEAAPVTPAATAAAAAGADEDEAGDSDGHEAELKAEPERRVRQRPPAPEPKRSGVGVAAWLILLIVIVGVVATGYVYRDKVVEFWPPAGKLYRTIGAPADKPDLGLVIRNVELSREIQGGQVVLLVVGEVVNNSGEKRLVPNLQITLGDENRQEIYHWTVTAIEAELPPGGTTRFQSRLPKPPDKARKLVVTFLPDAGG